MSAPELKKHENGIWYVHYYDASRRRTLRTTTGTKEIDGPRGAKAFFGAWLLTENQATPEAKAALTVRELWAPYFAKHIEKNSVSVGTTVGAWKNMGPHFGDLLPIQVNDDAVDDYVKLRAAGSKAVVTLRPGVKRAGLGKPSKPQTVRRELSALLACFNWCAATKRKIIAKADVPAFDLPPGGEPRDRWLRHEEVQRLLDAAAAKRDGPRLTRVERFLWLALETASRKTAIYQLTWGRVDFETGVINYDVPGRKRTKKRRSTPPISAALLPVLQRAYAERLDKSRADGLVLDYMGEIWHPLRAIAKAAGVADVSPHVLRHTAATHMARNGVPLWQVAGVLGNTMAMVEAVYSHHCPEGLVKAVNSISGGALLRAVK